MANARIATLHNENGEAIAPRTIAQAVTMASGENLESAMSNMSGGSDLDIDAIILAVNKKKMPVGYTFTWAPVECDNTDLSTAEKVAEYYGFGTWQQVAQGRSLVGVGTVQDNNNTYFGSISTYYDFKPGEMAGTYSHAHGSYNAQNGSLEAMIGAGYGDVYTIAYLASNQNPCVRSSYSVRGSSYSQPSTVNSHNTQVRGATASTSTMLPYLAVYVWQRVA